MLLRDKVAVIYGAGGAIGGAVARTFAREGAKVFLSGRNAVPVEAVARDIVAAGGEAEVASVDALDENAIEQHAAEIDPEGGSHRCGLQRHRLQCRAGRSVSRSEARRFRLSDRDMDDHAISDIAGRGATHGAKALRRHSHTFGFARAAGVGLDDRIWRCLRGDRRSDTHAGGRTGTARHSCRVHSATSHWRHPWTGSRFSCRWGGRVPELDRGLDPPEAAAVVG